MDKSKDLYEKYFINFGLANELESINIETIIMIATLFELEGVDSLIDSAKKICFNEGNNGFSCVEKEVDINNAKSFISGFDEVFTTNFDYILDDIFSKDVKHLHGGFDYFKVIYKRNNGVGIEKYDSRVKEFDHSLFSNEEINEIEQDCLIWGFDSEDKLRKSRGGFGFPISFPFFSPISLLNRYLENLKSEDYIEIHIWGYSGNNDQHINNAIKNNKHLKRIIYYCDPEKELNDEDFYIKIKSMFINNNSCLVLKPWNEIWDGFYNGNDIGD